jgi:hypothetical protein
MIACLPTAFLGGLLQPSDSPQLDDEPAIPNFAQGVRLRTCKLVATSPEGAAALHALADDYDRCVSGQLTN